MNLRKRFTQLLTLFTASAFGGAGCERSVKATEVEPTQVGTDRATSAPKESEASMWAEETTAMKDTRARLVADVERLASNIGERNTRHPEALAKSESYVEHRFRALGFEPTKQTYEVDGVSCSNVIVDLRDGRSDEVIVVGAHYDSAPGTPGADDNASGVAALIELAARLKEQPLEVPIVLVAFVNEEPPYFRTPDMGSVRYAELAVDTFKLRGMISLESLGYFDDTEGSQSYPPLVGALFPSQGNFLAVVGDLGSSAWVNEVADALDGSKEIPVERIAAPTALEGIDWSDHLGFIELGVPGLMITDTAVFRNPHYHEPTDKPEVVDFDRLHASTNAVEALLRAL